MWVFENILLNIGSYVLWQCLWQEYMWKGSHTKDKGIEFQKYIFKTDNFWNCVLELLR